MNQFALLALESLNQLLEAGISITALSLFIRALSFNLRDRVSRGFAIILACVTFIYGGEALSGAVQRPLELEFWLRVQWVGIVVIPAAYLHFSDALLETTGRPSRGRRRFLVSMTYVISVGMLILLPGNLLVGPLVNNGIAIPQLQQTLLSSAFLPYYGILILAAESLIVRAYQRTSQSISRRRMGFLLLGSFFVAIGSYPYVTIGSGFSASYPVIFLALAAIGNILVITSLITMAYATAFFGISWPDRIIKRRLLKWFLRGPVTIYVILVITTILQNLGELLDISVALIVTMITVISVLMMEHGITLASSLWERLLFSDGDNKSLKLIEGLEERLLTINDVRQYLQAVLSAVCDQFQVSAGFVATNTGEDWKIVVHVGAEDLLPKKKVTANAIKKATGLNGKLELVSWDEYWLLPIFSSEHDEMIGMIGVLKRSEEPLEPEQLESLEILGGRTRVALENLRLQDQVFLTLQSLSPRVEKLQKLRAATRYDQSLALSDSESISLSADMFSSVKDALSHYWGGPKLTKNPLYQFKVVQDAVIENDGNIANGIRSILKKAIEKTKPEGERKITGEWILYNILDLKFLQGRKVRDVALRLALSEADLYRKQRVAIENIADEILGMERVAQTETKSGGKDE